MQPDLSILIAAHDAEATLPRAIRSALAQQDVAVEVIVADDRSRDGTAEAAERFADDRVRLVRLSENRGPAGARNAALAAARAPFVAVLDADDEILPDRSRRLLDHIERSRADAVVDNLELVDPDGGRRLLVPPEALADAGEMTLADWAAGNRLFEGRYNYGYMKPLFRTASMRRLDLRWPEDLRIGEDFLILATLLARGGRCAIEPAAGYRYHVTGGSISRVLRLDHVRAMLAGDRALIEGHALEGPALAAMRNRIRTLEQAESFLAVVEAIKNRSPFRALARALRDPLAMRHFRMPLAARVRRLRHAATSTRTA